MKYFRRFCKLLCSTDYRRKEDLRIGETIVYLFCAGIFLFLAFSEIGRKLLLGLAVMSSFLVAGVCLIFMINEVDTIVKHFLNLKRKWEIDEITDIESVSADEATESNEQVEEVAKNYKGPIYFLDLTALEYYSGRFYAGFLTECFDYGCVTEEVNAVLMTDAKTIEMLKELEKESENKMIYSGYTSYIMRHFEILPNLIPSTLDNFVAFAQEEHDVTFVTKDELSVEFMESHELAVRQIED